MKNQCNIILVGLGGIAYKYDFLNDGFDYLSKNNFSNTHLSAALKAGNSIVGGVDNNAQARKSFQLSTNLTTWESLSMVSNDVGVDIFVVSSPEHTHYDVINEIVERWKPIGIICEKPFGNSSQESKRILDLVNFHNIPIIVNYTRQFSEDLNIIRDKMVNSKFVSGNFCYSHGLRRSGSHFIRLIIGILGKPNYVEIPEQKKGLETPSFDLVYENNRKFSFIESGGVSFRIGQGYLETENFILSIQEGSKFQIMELPAGSGAPFWPSQDEASVSGNLVGGLDQIYSNLNWFKPEKLEVRKYQNELDHLCNEIMDQISI